MTSSPSKRIAPPSGHPPPAEAALPGGDRIELIPLAEEICHRYRAEHPDEDERYGEAGNAWCVHDNQHILKWVALALKVGEDYLERQIVWLAGILEARDFPLERLARNLEIAADVVAEEGLEAMRSPLEHAAHLVRSKPSFLT